MTPGVSPSLYDLGNRVLAALRAGEFELANELARQWRDAINAGAPPSWDDGRRLLLQTAAISACIAEEQNRVRAQLGALRQAALVSLAYVTHMSTETSRRKDVACDAVVRLYDCQR